MYYHGHFHELSFGWNAYLYLSQEIFQNLKMGHVIHGTPLCGLTFFIWKRDSQFLLSSVSVMYIEYFK